MIQRVTDNDSIRVGFEKIEAASLSKHACLASASLGREHPEKACFIRTDFQRDVDRIIHSNSFRLLKHKTQAFLSPNNDHFRTRLTHTLEVFCTARSIARCLSLNSDLTEAIAFAHDVGHTPFGHGGEAVLNELGDSGFHHATHGVRVLTKLEKKGKGLNLTKEVIDGVLKHSKGRKGKAFYDENSNKPLTVEAQVVRIADLIAYLNHDLDDALRAGVVCNEELPKDLIDFLGTRHSVRIHKMIKDIIDNSQDSPLIKMSQPMEEATEKLKKFMFENVYMNPVLDVPTQKAKNLLRQIAEYYIKNQDVLLKKINKAPDDKTSFNSLLIDHLASMTDDCAIRTFEDIFMPKFDVTAKIFNKSGKPK